tara:strand:- start:2028 stop:2255 length:228 start_codon:yes stop_codon:yes gene_type:complete
MVGHLAVDRSMAKIATVLTLGIEKVGTSSVARSITNIVVIKVRATKVKTHLAERHLRREENRKYMQRNKFNTNIM